MEQYFDIINKRVEELIQITIKERTDKGLGVLFLDFSDMAKFDCRYIPYCSEYFPPELWKMYGERMNSVPKSIIFLYVYDKDKNCILEIDLDKDSNFLKTKSESKTI